MKPKGNNRQQEELLFNVGSPPDRRVRCPIVDAHTHGAAPVDTARFVRVARSYRINKVLVVTDFANMRRLRRSFPRFFEFAIQLDYSDLDDADKFQRVNLARLHRAAEERVKVIKFWFPPRFTVETNLKFDDERLAPLFDKIAELGMAVLVHIADPDVWFYQFYRDQDLYDTKDEIYVCLENVLRRHRKLTVMGAHMACDPEDLNHIDQLLTDHPNLIIDCSATKWLTRELSLKPEEGREFFIKWANRIIFATDLVVFKGARPGHYASRYWVQQMLWESDYVGDSPIYDLDACGPVHLHGLNLPDDVIRKLYYQNAGEYLGIHCADDPD